MSQNRGCRAGPVACGSGQRRGGRGYAESVEPAGRHGWGVESSRVEVVQRRSTEPLAALGGRNPSVACFVH